MIKIDYPFEYPNAEAAIAENGRSGLMALRKLISDTAQKTEGIGRPHETLKWGQPAYLTPETKSGSTIRPGLPEQGGFAVYTHCQTSILSDFQFIFPEEFTYEGNRAIHFQAGALLPLDRLEMLVSNALTYHL